MKSMRNFNERKHQVVVTCGRRIYSDQYIVDPNLGPLILQPRRSSPAEPLLLVDLLISFFLFSILDQAEHTEQKHDIDCYEAKERREDDVEELVGEDSKGNHAGPELCCDFCCWTCLVFNEQCWIVVATALEFEL